MSSSVRKSYRPLASRNMSTWGAAALMGTLAGATAWQPAAAQIRNEPALALSAFGNFYIGGSYDKAHAAHHHVGQMYVQYLIPADLKHRLPIVFIHGGDQTGASFLSTPDGRPGWRNTSRAWDMAFTS